MTGRPGTVGLSSIGKIERVPLRQVWRHEAHDLTRWLQENPDVLADALEFELTSIEREQSAGSFSVDLLGEDAGGRTVVIENQLERSDHDHLGKLITYVAFFDAAVAVWIVAEPRPEHVRAITWLNESAPADFFLLKIEGIRIAGSPPAPLLTRIVGPSEESREVGEVKKDRAERHEIRNRFWTEFLRRARERTTLFSAVSPTDQNWVATGAGLGGLLFSANINQHSSRADLYIDRGAGRDGENMAIFEALRAEREAIEEEFGSALDWQPLNGKRACRICKAYEGGYRDHDLWDQIYDDLIGGMIRLDAALRPRIARIARLPIAPGTGPS